MQSKETCLLDECSGWATFGPIPNQNSDSVDNAVQAASLPWLRCLFCLLFGTSISLSKFGQ